METKSFEDSVRFTSITSNGQTHWLPIVTAAIIGPTGNSVSLPFLFDTGASITVLRSEFYPFLGLNSWDEGEKVEASGIGGKATTYRYNITLEVFGKRINCPILLSQDLERHPLFSGLLGRDTVFNEFGFGFWESVHELYVTQNP
jgi:predicted aspartyl protease